MTAPAHLTPAPAAGATTPITAPTTWVLLRGLGRGSGHWGTRFIAQLQAALPQARLLVLDLPGNGVRYRERSPAEVGAMVDDVRARLRQTGVVDPCGVLALSLGAMVATEWGRRHPQELRAAVLINISLRPFSPAWQRMRPRAAWRLFALLVRNAPDEAWERTVLELTSNQAVSGRSGGKTASDAATTLAEWQHLRRTQPVATSNLLRQLLAAARHGAAPEPPAVPLLLLSGARDALVDPACSRELARRWRVPLVEHPAAGHDLPLDDGAWVADQLNAWLASRAGR